MIYLQSIKYKNNYKQQIEMFIVQTSVQKQKQILSSVFSSEGNSYSVPIHKISSLNEVIETMIYDLREQQKQNNADNDLSQWNLTQITDNFLKIITDSLRRQISLDLIRQTLKLLFHQEKVSKHHREYINFLDSCFCQENINETKNIVNPQVNDLTTERQYTLTPKIQNSFKFQIGDIEDDNIGGQKMTFSPKFYANLQARKSDCDQQTNSTLYCEVEPCKFFKSQTQKQETENLKMSSRFNPIPSILFEDNFNRMTKEEQKNDFEKSKSFINTCLAEGQSTVEKIYNQSMKMIKLKQKIRSISKKSSQKSLKKYDSNHFNHSKNQVDSSNQATVKQKIKYHPSPIIDKKKKLITSRESPQVMNNTAFGTHKDKKQGVPDRVQNCYNLP